MIRRLIETLIIEAFEHHGIAHKIKQDIDKIVDDVRVVVQELVYLAALK
jgi:hypothetical protein